MRTRRNRTRESALVAARRAGARIIVRLPGKFSRRPRASFSVPAPFRANRRQFRRSRLAPCLPSVMGGATMFRTITLFIVMALAGLPTTSLTCEVWCSTPATENHHRSAGCHEASPNPSHGPLLTANAGCHTPVAIEPFVTEARQTESSPLATLTPVVLIGSILVDSHGRREGWAAGTVPPPRESSLHLVLRI